MPQDEQIQVTRPTGLPYAQVSTAILFDTTLPALSRLLYAQLAGMANLGTRKAEVFRSTLAQWLGDNGKPKSLDTVDRYLRPLVERGILTVRRQVGPDGSLTASVYELHDTGPMGVPAPGERKVTAQPRPGKKPPRGQGDLGLDLPQQGPSEPERNAGTLIAEWIRARNGVEPDKQTKGRVARQLRRLLDDGRDYEHVRAGLAAWHRHGRTTPETIPSFVDQAVRGLAAPAGGRGSVAEVHAALDDIADQLRGQADANPIGA